MADYVNWDMTSFFPEFNGPEHLAHTDAVNAGIEALGRQAQELGPITQDNIPGWMELFLLDERVMAEYSHLACYIVCLSSADAANEAYSQADAMLSQIGAAFSKAMAPVMAALRDVPNETFEELLACKPLAGAGYSIRRLREEAARTMDPELEILAAELGVDGISAWGRLYDTLSGQIMFDMPDPESGGVKRVPMAQRRALLEDPDPEIRRNALVNGNAAWEQFQEVTAASLNSISGTRLTLNRRRGMEDFLEEPLFDAAVDRQTLDAMWREVAENKEVAWNYLRLKARCLKKQALGFQDLSCPLPFLQSRRYGWDEGVELMLGAFQNAYPPLADFARSMLDNTRVESEKRTGKRPGAFCTTSLKSRESRVFMSFGGGIGDVQTLAHELGHAYHGFLLRDKRPFASRYPMTLAETASTFAERLLQDAILNDPRTTLEERCALLTARCNDAATFMCDIRMRFLFENALYTERQKGALPVSRFKELMLDAQHTSYGDTLAADQLDPMFWASKLHFYITGVSFYNFPYTFGYLLSLSLCERIRSNPKEFLPKYEAFLRLSGSDTAENVAGTALGLDLRTPSFWRKAIDVIATDVDNLSAALKELGME